MIARVIDDNGTRRAIQMSPGDVLSSSSSGPVVIGSGTDGQVLTYDLGVPGMMAWTDPPGGSSAPTAAILLWPTASAPSGYLLCDGTAVSRTTYAALFAVLGTTYGVGDGSTTFNVPSLKGRVPVGLDSGQTEFDALAETGGAKTHTLASSEMPSHTHTQDSHNHIQDAHTHTQNSHNHTQDTHTHTQNAHTHNFLPRSATTGSVSSIVTGTLDTSSTISGANQPHVQDATATNQNATATNQAATATNQNATATNQVATATNQNTGGGGAHNNLQPYLVLNFIIKT